MTNAMFSNNMNSILKRLDFKSKVVKSNYVYALTLQEFANHPNDVQETTQLLDFYQIFYIQVCTIETKKSKL